MADTNTPKLGLVKPEPTASRDTWGAKLNSNFDVIDNLAPLASPVFTGDPKAPNPAPGDNDTSIATTSFVKATVDAGVATIPPFPEAPNDGKQYARQSLAWASIIVPPSTSISDTAPSSPSPGQLWWESDSGNTFIWVDDGNTQQWVQQNVMPQTSGGNSFMMWPAGVGVDWWGLLAPQGTLFCAGQAVSRVTYAALFSAIGTQFGAGDGSTTFLLPDARGRTTAGKDNMGGTAANRLTALLAIGAAGGAETHALITAELAAHAHTQQGTFGSGGQSVNHTHAQTFSSGNATGSSKPFYNSGSGSDFGPATSLGSVDHTHSTTISGATTNTGSGTAHNNTQPTIVCNKLITTGGVA